MNDSAGRWLADFDMPECFPGCGNYKEHVQQALAGCNIKGAEKARVTVWPGLKGEVRISGHRLCFNWFTAPDAPIVSAAAH